MCLKSLQSSFPMEFLHEKIAQKIADRGAMIAIAIFDYRDLAIARSLIKMRLKIIQYNTVITVNNFIM